MNNQMTAETSTEINFDLLARFQVMGRGIVKTRDGVWSNANTAGTCDLLPREILSKKPRIEMFKDFFTYSNLNIEGRINVPAGNEMLIKQAGRALALSQSYEIVGNANRAYENAGVTYPAIRSSNPMNVVKYGKVMRHVVTGQLIGAVMVIDRASSNPADVCEVYKFNHITEKWLLHPVTILVRNGEMRNGKEEKGAFQWNRELEEFTPAYTKYNFLAAMLSGVKIHIVYNYEKGMTLNQAAWFQLLVETFRRELWSKVCGYGWQIEKAYSEMWVKVQPEIGKMLADGWTLDEINELL